jgi:Cu/Ag efflux protein CusF
MRVWTLCPLTLVVVVATCASNVRADQIHLVGGAQLEGKATRHGQQVVIDMGSGQITLSADSVERIERGQSAVQRYEQLESKLKPGDVQGLLSLADFCRDHDMQAREKELLRRVLEVDPDHAQARDRLGYVRAGARWITREEQLRAQGMVRVDGQWMTAERALDIERLRAEAAQQRDRAQAELETKKVELEKRKIELQTEQVKAEHALLPSNSYGVTGYGLSYGYAPFQTCAHGRCGGARVAPAPSARPFPIPGVRDPRDTSFPINGVRDPRSY